MPWMAKEQPRRGMRPFQVLLLPHLYRKCQFSFQLSPKGHCSNPRIAVMNEDHPQHCSLRPNLLFYPFGIFSKFLRRKNIYIVVEWKSHNLNLGQIYFPKVRKVCTVKSQMLQTIFLNFWKQLSHVRQIFVEICFQEKSMTNGGYTILDQAIWVNGGSNLGRRE